MKRDAYKLEVALNSEPFPRDACAVAARLTDGTGRAVTKDMIPDYANTPMMKANVHGVVLFCNSSIAVAMMERL